MAKLLDFGLVKPATGPDSIQRLAGGHDRRLATLHVARAGVADTSSPDCRSDIYSLGAVAYYLLTGHPPFQAETRCERHDRAHAETPWSRRRRSGRGSPTTSSRSSSAAWRRSPRPLSRHAEPRPGPGRLAEADGWSPRHAAEWWMTHQGARSPRHRPSQASPADGPSGSGEIGLRLPRSDRSSSRG